MNPYPGFPVTRCPATSAMTALGPSWLVVTAWMRLVTEPAASEWISRVICRTASNGVILPYSAAKDPIRWLCPKPNGLSGSGVVEGQTSMVTCTYVLRQGAWPPPPPIATWTAGRLFAFHCRRRVSKPPQPRSMVVKLNSTSHPHSRCRALISRYRLTSGAVISSGNTSNAKTPWWAKSWST